MIYHVLDEREPFSDYFGGAIQRWVANVLRNDGNSVVVCGESDGSWQYDPARVMVLPGIKALRWLRGRQYYPDSIRSRIVCEVLAPLVRRVSRGDVVWVQNAPDFASALASRIHGGGGKVVLHKHNTFSVSRSAESVAKIIRSVDKVVFCCNYLNLDTRERFPWFQHSAIIANGADSSLFYPEVQKGSNSKPIIAFAGRIVKEKGVHILLNAMRILLERRVDVEARIFGGSAFGGSKPTPYLTDLEAAAPPNVKFMGYAASKDLARHLRTADVFCSPSIWNEPFAMVNLEAMASGLPVVTTRVGGVPEAFTEGGGVLVPPGSSVALANALESVIKNPELRERLSHEGRQAFLKRFTWNCISRQYHELAGSL